jgi:glycosyltransferase involved in cell wall biosynthesis
MPNSLYDGEDLRVYHFAKYLAENNEVHFLGFGDNRAANETTLFFKTVQVVSDNHGTKTAERRSLTRCLAPADLYPYNSRMQSALSNMLGKAKFDVLWVPSWRMAPYSEGIKDLPVAMDVMDDGVLELVRELKGARLGVDFIRKCKRLLVTWSFEKKYFSRASVCSFVTARDADMFRRICPSTKITVIPNGVDAEFYQPLGEMEEFPSLIFEGNMGFPPNVDAACYFCRAIFPKILKRVPAAKLFLVGKDPAPQVRALQSHSVTVTGYVDDVRYYLDRATVFICPMRKGAGIKNKMLQAWAMAKPVVATSLAVAGLEAIHMRNVLIADNPYGFSKAVLSLLDGSIDRKSLGVQARRTAVDHYSWKAQVKLFESELLSL